METRSCCRPTIDIPDAVADLKASDQLRSPTGQLTQWFQRLQNFDLALQHAPATGAVPA